MTPIHQSLTGTIQKMYVQLNDVVDYVLQVGDNTLDMNPLIGSELSLQHTGNIYCCNCGKKTKKSFMQGFCYPCMVNSPQAAECIIRPELCQAHEGIGRDPEWEEKHHNQPHYVYLAKSSVIKVGVTRDTQVPIRWIDQGASAAAAIAKTPNRYLAGCIEVTLKAFITDRTSWQKMLKNDLTTDSLEEAISQIQAQFPEAYSDYLIDSPQITQITYPVRQYPEKVKSVNIDKTPEFSGTLNGIKGQYLLFDNGYVLNARKYTGYEFTITHI